VVLKQAKNVKYGQFVVPGQTLTVHAEIFRQEETETQLKARGSVDGRITVSGRLVLATYNLADTDPSRAGVDETTRQELRKLFALLYAPRQVVRKASVE
jgi:3-hydroxyacyl-[acyl-carrier-protein] dehydratase